MRSRADSPLTPARDRTTAPKEPLVAGNALPPQATATLMLALQRMAGNQAVASLLTSGTNRPDLPVLIQRAPPASAPPRPRTRRKPPAASKPARGQKFDAFAEKSYDLKTTDGVLRFAADLHTELLHEYLDLPARTDGQVKLLAGRALFIYTEYYLPRLRASAGSTTPDLLMKATVKAVADARQEAGDEAVAATRISAADYRSLFPLTTARQYDDEATRLRAIPVDPVLEQYKLQAATDEKREDFIFWGRAQYADRSTADLFEAEAKRIRQGQRKGLGFSDDKVFFPLKGRETAEKTAAAEYVPYCVRVRDPGSIWAPSHIKQAGRELDKENTEILEDWQWAASTASKLRETLGKQVLPESIVDNWRMADLSFNALAPSAKAGTADSELRAVALAAVTNFYTSFRAEVAPRDERKAVHDGKGVVFEYMANPYLTVYEFEQRLLPGLNKAKSRDEWLAVFKSFREVEANLDTYIGDKLTQKGRTADAEQFKEAGSRAGELSKLLTKHPELLDTEKHPEVGKVRAVFYPENALQNVGQPGTPEFHAQGIPLFFYLYREGTTWFLEDVSTPLKVKLNSDSGGTATAPPYELFEQLNSKLRFPKGQLYWTLPNGAFGNLRTTEDRLVSEWLTWIGLGLAVIAITAATAGAGTAATVLLIGSSLAGAAAATADLVEKSHAGVLTEKDILVDTLSIVANLAMAASAGLGKIVVSSVLKTGTYARIGALADAAFAPVTLTAVGADVASFAVFASDSWATYEALDKSEGSEADRRMAKARIIAQFLAMGTMTLLSVMGSLPNAMKGRNLHLDVDRLGRVVARPLMSEGELLKAAKSLGNRDEITKLLADLPADQAIRVRAALSQALSVGPVGATRLDELIGRLRAARGVDELNTVLSELTSRSRVGAFIGGTKAGIIPPQDALRLDFLDNEALAALKKATPAELANIASLVGTDPGRINGLLRKYGSEVLTVLRTRPANLDALENGLANRRQGPPNQVPPGQSGPVVEEEEPVDTTDTTTGTGKKGAGTGVVPEPVVGAKPGRVRGPVPGVFESIDPNWHPDGWTIEHSAPRPVGGNPNVVEIETIVTSPVNRKGDAVEATGRMTRRFDRTKSQLVMSSASLEDLPSKMRTPVSMTAEGTPTFTVLSMQQMKLFGIGYGELSSVSMEHIVNVRAVCELAVLEAQGVPLEEALMKVHSVQYAQTTIEQSGNQIVGLSVTDPGTQGTMRDFLEEWGFFSGETDPLGKWGGGKLTPDSKARWWFTFELKTAPWAGAK